MLIGINISKHFASCWYCINYGCCCDVYSCALSRSFTRDTQWKFRIMFSSQPEPAKARN